MKMVQSECYKALTNELVVYSYQESICNVRNVKRP